MIPASAQSRMHPMQPLLSCPHLRPLRHPHSSPYPTNSSWITLTAPTGGDVITDGDTYRITWQSSPNIALVDIGIWYQCTSCSPYWAYVLEAGSIPNTGYYDWNVNVTDPAGKEFEVGIEDSNYSGDPGTFAISWPFTVAMPNTPTTIPDTATMPADTSTVTPTWTPSAVPTDTSLAPDTDTPTPTPVPTDTPTFTLIPTNTQYLPDTDTPTNTPMPPTSTLRYRQPTRRRTHHCR